MDAIMKFKEAAKELQNEEVYKAMVAAREANDTDESLQDLIGEFNLLRLDLNNEMSKDDRDEQKVAEMNKRINELYNEVMQNEKMLAYNQAKQDIENFIEYVNAILNAAIEGEDPMLVEEPSVGGCASGGCSSCSGCQ